MGLTINQPNTQEGTRTQPGPFKLRPLEGTPEKQETLEETSIFTQHEHYGEKYKNWHLQPKRTIIIKDSNRSKLPEIKDNRIQVDCYPEAQFTHAIHIIKNKTPTSGGTLIIILSFGINKP